MTLYWYSKPYKHLREWTYFNTAKIILAGNKKITLKINKDTHQIDLENYFTEILSENLPIKLVPQAVELEITDNLNLKQDSWTIKSQKYNISIIDDFLKTPDCIFYNFEDTDDWTIIKWSQNGQDRITFETLRSFKDDDIILRTASEYYLE